VSADTSTIVVKPRDPGEKAFDGTLERFVPPINVQLALFCAMTTAPCCVTNAASEARMVRPVSGRVRVGCILLERMSVMREFAFGLERAIGRLDAKRVPLEVLYFAERRKRE
jgi:hypothetical protein